MTADPNREEMKEQKRKYLNAVGELGRFQREKRDTERKLGKEREETAKWETRFHKERDEGKEAKKQLDEMTKGMIESNDALAKSLSDTSKERKRLINDNIEFKEAINKLESKLESAERARKMVEMQAREQFEAKNSIYREYY